MSVSWFMMLLSGIWLLRGLLRETRVRVWSVSIIVLGVPDGMAVS